MVALAGAAIVGCRSRSPKVPTRAAAKSSTTALGPDLAAEILDTEDGEIRIDANDPQRGPRDATCVIVVFSDFQCPFCRDVAVTLDQLRKDLPKKVRIVFKHRPLPSHSNSRMAAVASQVVFLEGGSEAFWHFHDRCFAHPHDIDVSRLTAWAHEEGVKAEAIVDRGPEAERIVGQHIALADRLGVHGTPRLYINSRRVAGSVPYEQLRDWVDDEV